MRAAPNIAVKDQPAARVREPVRVLVVDDSPTVRAVLARVVSAEADMEVAACEGSAEDALASLRRSNADVILLDLDMPGMGGLEAIPQMLAVSDPARILVLSSLAVRGAEHTLTALSLGAADTLAKPRPGQFDAAYRALLLRKIRLLGQVARRIRNKASTPVPARLRPHPREAPSVLAIGASTGGIHALGQLLGALPPRLSLPILVTQHLPGTFSDAFVRQLQIASGRGTLIAREGIAVLPGQILVAPGEAHMTVTASRQGPPVIRLDSAPAPSGCRPSVDPMFASCAAVYGAHALGVVLSGMGRDGVLGAAKIVEAGGTVMAQDAASCAVWGMPGAIAEAGLASAVLPPAQIAGRIVAQVEVP
jgi:two-component system chemotaxis response regulator CheB